MPMNVSSKIEEFLKEKKEQTKLRRIHIAQKTNISPFTINKIMSGHHNDVTFEIILKLANYFQCTTDEVLRRDKFKSFNNNQFAEVSAEDAMLSLRKFIKEKMKETESDVSIIAKNCGLDQGAFRGFIQENSHHKSIRGNHILALIDTFSVSLDELIGRSQPINISKETNLDQDLNAPSNNNRPVPQKLSSEFSKLVKKIQKPLKDYLLPNDQISTTHHTPTQKAFTKHKNNSLTR